MVNSITSGDPSGLNRFLSEFGQELCEYIRALVGDDDVRFATLFEDIVVDVLRRIRSGVERRNGDFRRFVFECASQTVRRLHGWVFVSNAAAAAGPRISRASLKDLQEIGTPDPANFRRAVSMLTADERELLILRYRFGFSYDDISEIRSEARVNFEDRLQVAREHFRSCLLSLSNTPQSPRPAKASGHTNKRARSATSV